MPGALAGSRLPGSVHDRDPFVRIQIEELISKVLGVNAADVHAAARLRDDFGVDSLDLLELAVEMESRLDVRIPDRALRNLTTVDDVVGVASRALAATREHLALALGQVSRRLQSRARRARTAR